MGAQYLGELTRFRERERERERVREREREGERECAAYIQLHISMQKLALPCKVVACI